MEAMSRVGRRRARVAAPADSDKMIPMRMRRTRRSVLLAAPWIALCACGPGCEPGDGAGADGDGGADSDSASDTGVDGDCPGYPAGPYDWDLGEVVTAVQFQAVYGAAGALTVLDMCDVLDGADDVKSYVFVIGTTTCPYCPERFTEIGDLDLAAYGAEKVAVYYDDQATTASLTAEETGDIADTYGWVGGWRISDTADQTIFYGGYPDWLWQTTPNVFVLDAHAMRITAAEKGSSPVLLDVLAEIQAIDAEHP
jgi:hypothetical protein